MIKDGSSLTAWIIWASQINCSLQTLPPPSFFTRSPLCFHSPFLTFIHLLEVSRSFLSPSPHLTPFLFNQFSVLPPLYLFELFLSLFISLSPPSPFLSFLWEGGMSSTAAYRQFLQDLEEKRGRCHLQTFTCCL